MQGNDAGKAIDWLVLAGDCHLECFAVKAEQYVMRRVPCLSEHAKAELLSNRYV